MTPTKATFRGVLFADAAAAAGASYGKAVTTPAANRLGVTLFCASGAIQYALTQKGASAPSNLVMGQLAAGQSVTLGAEDSLDLWVRQSGGAATYCATELVQ